MNSHLARRALLVIALFASLALVACGGSKTASVGAGVATGTEAGGTSVNVTLKEFAIAIDQATVPAGEITFRVKNGGTIVHEMVVAKTDLAPEKLPLLTAGSTIEEGHAVGDVDEEQLDSPGEVSDVPVGQTSNATFKLEPGKYVLYCNLAGHYKLGMFTTFIVE